MGFLVQSDLAGKHPGAGLTPQPEGAGERGIQMSKRKRSVEPPAVNGRVRTNSLPGCLGSENSRMTSRRALARWVVRPPAELAAVRSHRGRAGQAGTAKDNGRQSSGRDGFTGGGQQAPGASAVVHRMTRSATIIPHPRQARTASSGRMGLLVQSPAHTFRRG